MEEGSFNYYYCEAPAVAHVFVSNSHASSSRFSAASKPPNSRSRPSGSAVNFAKSRAEGWTPPPPNSTLLHSQVSCKQRPTQKFSDHHILCVCNCNALRVARRVQPTSTPTSVL